MSLPGDRRFYGIGEKTFLMGFVVELIEILARGLFFAGEGDLRMKDDPGEPGFSVFTFFEKSDRRVFVAVDDITAHRGDREKGEEMATRERSGESLFGIQAIRCSQVGRGCRGFDRLAAPGEVPLMGAREFLVAEATFSTGPRKGCKMFAHL